MDMYQWVWPKQIYTRWSDLSMAPPVCKFAYMHTHPQAGKALQSLPLILYSGVKEPIIGASMVAEAKMLL